MDDAIQGFLASQVLEKDLIAKAQRERGKFRTFLLTALSRYLVSEFRKKTTLRRAPQGLVDMTGVDPPAQGACPDQGFEVEWARLVLKQTIERLREECIQLGREDVWGVFEARLYLPLFHEHPKLSYAQIVSRYRIKSPTDASNLLVAAKRMFRRLLRSVISEYAIHDPNEVDEEIADLMKILAKAGPPQTEQAMVCLDLDVEASREL